MSEEAISPKQKKPRSSSGILVVVMLLAAFGYGIFQYYETTQVPQGFRMTPVESNLRTIFLAAQTQFVAGAKGEITYPQLLAMEGGIEPVSSVYGETYEEIWLDRETTAIAVVLPDGGPEIEFSVTPRELIELRERMRQATAGP